MYLYVHLHIITVDCQTAAAAGQAAAPAAGQAAAPAAGQTAAPDDELKSFKSSTSN